MNRYITISALLALFATTACTHPEFARVDLRRMADAPAETSITERSIQLPVGIAVEIAAEVTFKEDEYYTGDYFHLAAEDNDILGVAPMAGKEDKYLIWGKYRGVTCLQINIAGTVEDCISVEITESEEL